MKGIEDFQTLQPQRRPLTPSASTGRLGRSILERIAWNLPVGDLFQFAQASRLCRDIAYNEELWESRLAVAGLTGKGRSRRTRHRVQPSTVSSKSGGGDGNQDKETGPKTLFSAEAGPGEGSKDAPWLQRLQPQTAIDLFRHTPGHAREEVLQLFRALGPLYYDLADNVSNNIIFARYRDPRDQARILNQLRIFSDLDPLEDDHFDRQARIISTTDLFENAALHEFESGLDSNDIENKVRLYGEVLWALNGGESCIQLFIQKSELLDRGASDASIYVGENGKPDLAKLQEYFNDVADSLNEQGKVIDQVFGTNVGVMYPLLERVLEDSLMETVSAILDRVKRVDEGRYLDAVPQIYGLLSGFVERLVPCENIGPSYHTLAQTTISDLYTYHINAFLQLENQHFRQKADAAVDKWTKQQHDQQEATESLFWSNVTKEKDKSDFLSSFKRVLMMPVSVMTSSSTNNSNLSLPITPAATPPPQHSTDATTTPAQHLSANSAAIARSQSGGPSTAASGPTNPGILNESPDGNAARQLPTTELDAVLAVMNSKLESIQTLISLELALNLIRMGKESIERMRAFVSIEGESAAEAKKECEQIFVDLVAILGGKHVKFGFDSALHTLQEYDPKKHRRTTTTVGEDGAEKSAVEPLAIFAELVNIGDLIQQMVHVFFEEELAIRKIVDRSDFLSAALKAKKRFEKMLDDCVANGLSRGIDVLIDQIDFIFVTDQLASDFNPIEGSVPELGPTLAAKKAVSLLRSHMTLLVGSTEKSVIDVFQQEVAHRFYNSICKHIKRNVISVDGAVTLISDLNYYYDYIQSLKQRQVLPYFEALKEVGNLYLIDGKDAKALGSTLSDMARFRGVLNSEELMEFVQSRKDWLLVRRDVERVMYGFGVDCIIA